jgi:hypothetical protein
MLHADKLLKRRMTSRENSAGEVYLPPLKRAFRSVMCFVQSMTR